MFALLASGIVIAGFLAIYCLCRRAWTIAIISAGATLVLMVALWYALAEWSVVMTKMRAGEYSTMGPASKDNAATRPPGATGH